jgi:hypothetical protein
MCGHRRTVHSTAHRSFTSRETRSNGGTVMSEHFAFTSIRTPAINRILTAAGGVRALPSPSVGIGRCRWFILNTLFLPNTQRNACCRTVLSHVVAAAPRHRGVVGEQGGGAAAGAGGRKPLTTCVSEKVAIYPCTRLLACLLAFASMSRIFPAGCCLLLLSRLYQPG